LGAGGVMLPNHAPLIIAEQFGTLESLYPGRIDLGLGRAPGTDQITAQALRRNLAGGADSFPNDVVELLSYFAEARPGQQVRAVPGMGLHIPIWILGSSLYGAQLAAAFGLPYAFASHFAPADMMEAISVYRGQFRASEYLAKPYMMLGMALCAADTDEEARFLFSSQQQSFLNLRLGRPGRLPPPIKDFEEQLPSSHRAALANNLAAAVVGSPATLAEGLKRFIARTGADEIMTTSYVYDHAARLRSLEIVAQVRDRLA
jgi:luciferase family oxidoreductase group 1